MNVSIDRAVKAVIGTIINHPELLDEAKARMRPEDIPNYDLQLLYQAILATSARNVAVDMASVSYHMQPHPFNDVLWHELISCGRVDNFKDHLGIIKNEAIKRAIRGGCLSTLENLKANPSLSAEVALASHSSVINDICNEAGNSESAQSYADMMPSFLLDLKNRVNNGDGITGASSGFHDLDQKTAGWQPGDLVILAARPSMGKTALAMNMAEAVLDNSGRALIFSLEMPGKALLQRSISSVGGINHDNLRRGQLTELEAAKLGEASRKVNSYDIVVDDASELTITELRLRALKHHRERKLDLIVIDYLQLMSASDIKADKKSDQISHISRGLKMLAKELEVPIIALSQLNRGVESRPDKRPVNSDLRESGAIEQDADIILFVYRDEYYNEDSPEKGIAEIIIGKQRNGPLGTVRLRFQGQYSRFVNIRKVVDTEDPSIPPAQQGYTPEVSAPAGAPELF